MRLIDAENIFHKVSIIINVSRATLGEQAILWWFQSMIEDAPTVQAELVKHGRWIDIPDKPEWDQKKCSICGDIRCCQGKYCSNCGARMDGEENGTV